MSEEPKAGEIVFKFKDKVSYEDGESAFRLRLDLPSLEATYLVTSSPGATSRNILARAPHPPPHLTPGECWGSLPSDLRKIISTSQRHTVNIWERAKNKSRAKNTFSL